MSNSHSKLSDAWLDKTRDDIWSSLQSIFEHFKAPKKDRYAGEFPYPDKNTGLPKLSKCFSFRDAEIRDNLATALRTHLTDDDFECVSVVTEDNEDSKHWPYSLDISVTGDNINSLQQAYEKMAKYLQKVSKTYPAPYKGIPWEDYCKSYQVDDQMTYKTGADSQIEMFEIIPKLYKGIEMHVVGMHSSKSIKLPVIQIELPENRTLITIRDNFHDICVSVDSKFPIKDNRNFSDLFNKDKKTGFFEGFPSDNIHDGYNNNQKKFSLAVHDYPSLMILLSDLYHQDLRTTLTPKQSPKNKI